jgi:ribosomal-protein-alanine N-acetyltransferase
MFPQHTRRLFFREITRADIDPIYAFASDPLNTQHLIWGPASRRAVRSFVRRCDVERRLTPRARWSLALVERETLDIIGIIYIERLRNDPTTVQMGCMIARAHWRNGFADEVTDERVRFAFEDLGARKIIATSSPANTGSIHNLQKHGLEVQGLLPDAVAHRGETRDSLLFERKNPAWQEHALPTPIAV